MESKTTDIDISSAASAMGKKRWAGLSEEQRNAAMEKARAERQRKLTKAQRSEIARGAVEARWKKWREEHPESDRKPQTDKPVKPRARRRSVSR